MPSFCNVLLPFLESVCSSYRKTTWGEGKKSAGSCGEQDTDGKVKSVKASYYNDGNDVPGYAAFWVPGLSDARCCGSESPAETLNTTAG